MSGTVTGLTARYGGTVGHRYTNAVERAAHDAPTLRSEIDGPPSAYAC